MTLRHDAALCRSQARSEVLRHSLGILTPAERAQQEAAEEEKRKDEAKAATKGPALFNLD